VWCKATGSHIHPLMPHNVADIMRIALAVAGTNSSLRLAIAATVLSCAELCRAALLTEVRYKRIKQTQTAVLLHAASDATYSNPLVAERLS